jgi:uncharacterized membrane protein
MSLYFYLLIVVAAITGLVICWYIDHHKRHQKVLVCPLNSNCDRVVHSEYSRFLGFHLEHLGMIYYGLIALIYLIIIGAPQVGHTGVAVAVALISIFAFLFSGYLTYIQFSRLKEWCVLCITSALCCSIIFLALLGNWLTV